MRSDLMDIPIWPDFELFIDDAKFTTGMRTAASISSLIRVERGGKWYTILHHDDYHNKGTVKENIDGISDMLKRFMKGVYSCQLFWPVPEKPRLDMDGTEMEGMPDLVQISEEERLRKKYHL